MAGLVPATQKHRGGKAARPSWSPCFWIPGTSPGMTFLKEDG